MAARQMRILAGSASAVAAVMLALAGCAAASHPTANEVPRPASQTAAAGHASQAARQAGAAVRLASPRLKCADPVAAGRAPGGGGGARGTTGQVRQMTTLGGNVSPAPLATPGRATVQQAGVVHLTQPGLVVLCGPVTGHCPPGFRTVFHRAIASGRPPVLLPRMVACIRFTAGTSPEPQLSPLPVVTRPLHTMPPQAARG